MPPGQELQVLSPLANTALSLLPNSRRMPCASAAANPQSPRATARRLALGAWRLARRSALGARRSTPDARRLARRSGLGAPGSALRQPPDRLRLEFRVDLFARRAHRELLGVATRNPQRAAQSSHGLTAQRRLHDLVFGSVVGETLMVALFNLFAIEKFFKFAVERVGSAAGVIGVSHAPIVDHGHPESTAVVCGECARMNMRRRHKPQRAAQCSALCDCSQRGCHSATATGRARQASASVASFAGETRAAPRCVGCTLSRRSRDPRRARRAREGVRLRETRSARHPRREGQEPRR